MDNTQQSEHLVNGSEKSPGFCDSVRKRFGHLMCNRLFISLLVIIFFFLLLTVTSLVALLNKAELLSSLHFLLSVSGLLWTLYLFRRASKNLVHPLSDLREWTERMSQGDLTARVPCPEQGQLRNLFEEINILSDTFSEISRNMEEKVQQQTRYIAKKNVTLQILYDVASSVNTTQDIVNSLI